MFNFPDSPTANQIINMPDGTTRMWDGTKWRAAGLAPGPYLPLSGGSLTGPLALAADPTSAMQAATKEYVDAEALNNTGRNLVHNAQFNIQQRGTGPWTSSMNYTADRWRVYFLNDTVSVSLVALTDAQRTSIGDDAATSAASLQVTGSATAGSTTQFFEYVENVRRLSNKTVTASFWAWSASGTPNLGISFQQGFGSGGSPSAPVTTALSVVALTTIPARYSVTMALPSVAGKTFGTNNDSGTAIIFTPSSQGTSVGVQSGTIMLWGVQLEVGTQATPLAKRDPADDLALCQRFYQTGSASVSEATQTLVNGWGIQRSFNLPVSMRATPTVSVSGTPTSSACSSVAFGALGPTSIYLSATITQTGGGYSCSAAYAASADL